MELKFRNVAACDLKVYRIDLMKFGLLKRNLARNRRDQPGRHSPAPRGHRRAGRRQATTATEPASCRCRSNRRGAYLIVCRGDDLHASGLALVTPLAVEVQADAVSGRVRTTVKDRVADKYLHDVDVKVIGSGNEDFVSGQTDLRGVFVADGIRGGATVIAQAGPGRYAFYRAKETLLAQAVPAQRGELPRQPPQAAATGHRASPAGVSLTDDARRREDQGSPRVAHGIRFQGNAAARSG